MRELEQFILRELVADPAIGRIAPDADLLERGIIDSLGLMHLISFVEERFGVAVTDDDLVAENFRTIERIEGFVAAKKGAAGQRAEERAVATPSQARERALHGAARLLSPLRRRRDQGAGNR